jgi:hypothetical protein
VRLARLILLSGLWGLAMLLMLLAVVVADAHCQALPDAPSSVPRDQAIVRQADGTYCIGTTCGWKQADIPPAGPTFWTFRGVVEVDGRRQFDWNAPALRSFRGVLDKKFVILHGLAAVAMVVACRRRNSGEDFGSEIPAVLGVTAMDGLASAFFSESMSVGGPAYMLQHYTRSAAR